MRVEDDITVYDACIVICNWRYTTFAKVSPQGKNSMDRILQAGMKMSTGFYDKFSKKVTYGEFVDTPFDINAKCVPIRISSEDEINLIYSDWCTSASPIKELNYDSIPRWWPIDWIFKKSGVIPDFIKIDLGSLSKTQHIVLECKIVKKPKSEIMNTVFSDIFIEGIDDLNLIPDRQLDNDKDKNDDIVSYDVITTEDDKMLFGKNKKKEDAINNLEQQKCEVEADITKPEDDIEEETIMSDATEKKEEATTTATTIPAPAKRKKIPTWVKVTGGIVIGSAIIGGGIYAYTKLKGKAPAAK